MNSIGRRSNVQEQGTAYPGNAAVDWGYNARGEVTLHNHSANANDRVFEFDGIGNRTKGAVGTVLPVGADTVSNALNQYTNFTGSNLGYDFDGNLTTDGGANASGTPRTYQWDGQNQLRQVSLTTGGAVLASFRYDPSGRRISKTGSGVTTWYVYDGWNLIAEYQSGTLQRKHVWGPDLSGSAQGAGGIGGLLCTHIGSSRYYPLYDGSGNICQYLDAAGAIAAKYEYGPFGQLHSASGSASGSLRFRFSTKYADPETGDYYYGYRYYSAWMGRWLSRDPIGEHGGTNLYDFVWNNPSGWVDVLGRNPIPVQGGFGFHGWTFTDEQGKVWPEDGNFEDRAGGRENSNVGGGETGKDMLEHMKNLTKNNCCLQDYRIAGHGWGSGRGDGVPSYHPGDEEGFNLDKTKGRPSANGDVRDVNDLKNEISKGSIKFCRPCTISIFSCRISDAFIQGLAQATGCKVTAAGGACRRNPNGAGWESNADKPGDSNKFRQSNGGTVPVDAEHIFIPPLYK